MKIIKKTIFLMLIFISTSAFSYNLITLPSHLSSAHAYIDAQMYKNAVQSLKKFDPKSDAQVAELNYALGKIYLGIDQPQKAISYFENSLSDAPNHYQSILGLAQAQIKLGEIKEAKRYLAKASKLTDASLEVAYHEAVIEELTGNSNLADQRLLDLIYTNPNLDLPATYYARLLLQRGQVNEAINFLSKALQAKPESAHIKSLLADTLFLAKQKNLAIEYKKQAIRLYVSKKEYEKAQTSILVLHKNAPETKAEQLGAVTAKEDKSESNKNNPKNKKELNPNPQISNQTSPEDGASDSESVPFARAIINQKRLSPVPETQSLEKINNFSKFPFGKGTPVTGGSGVVIDGGRKVITNRHVVEGGKDFAIKNGLGNTSKAKVVFISKTDDIAILELNDPFSSEHSINNYQFQKAKAGSDVVVMGYPLWYVLGTSTPSITNGVVAKGTGVNEDPTNFQLTAKVNKGNSGGPVFDMYGNLIGITQGKLDSEVIKRGDGYAPEDINFAIHIERITNILNYKKNDYVGASKNTPMKPEDLYQAMIGKVVMVAVAVD